MRSGNIDRGIILQRSINFPVERRASINIRIRLKMITQVPAEPGSESAEDSFPDLVILDMMMPVMGGAETFIRLRKIQPDVPILMYSGFALDQSAIDSFSGGRWKFLRKPFTNDELQVIVNQLFASPPTKNSEEDS